MCIYTRIAGDISYKIKMKQSFGNILKGYNTSTL